MLSDAINSVKAQLYDRATSPLIGAFLLSWIAWNHRFLIVLVSSQQPREKFWYVDQALFPGWRERVLDGVLIPLVIAVAFLFVYPLPARLVFKWWREQVARLSAIQVEIEDEEPITQKEARKLRRSLRDLQDTYELKLNARDEKIASLQAAIADREQSDAADVPPFDGPQVLREDVALERDRYLMALLDLLRDGGRKSQESVRKTLASRLQSGDPDLLRIDQTIDTARERKFVARHTDGFGENAELSITPKGRTTLVDFEDEVD